MVEMGQSEWLEMERKMGGRGQKWGVKKGGNGGRQRKAMGVWMGADFGVGALAVICHCVL